MGMAAMMNAYFICHNVQVKYSFPFWWISSRHNIWIMSRTLCGLEEWDTGLQRRRSTDRRCSQSSCQPWLPDNLIIMIGIMLACKREIKFSRTIVNNIAISKRGQGDMYVCAGPKHKSSSLSLLWFIAPLWLFYLLVSFLFLGYS